MARPAPSTARVGRLSVRVRGAVQGVGFRPYACTTARRLGLSGFVRNEPGGVLLEAEGATHALDRLLGALRAPPPPARVDALTSTSLAARGERGFRIAASDAGSSGALPLPPDLATCAACMAEVLTPGDRRYRHPFASCASCGPRYSALLALPWDRAHTSMAGFPPCSRCRAEHDDPSDRRFHAQTLACPDCGPRLRAVAPDGTAVAEGEPALARATAMLRAGGIVAMLGLGGFQLLTDACDESAVRRLRKRKGRPAKPLAILVSDLEAARRLVELDRLEAESFASPAGPIVLARRRFAAGVAPSVAPGVAWLGVLRPTTPLHRLIADAASRPLVATSGNRSGEPLCASDAEALDALADVADLFLTHDRPVVRPIDDAVVRSIAGRIVTLRAGRGIAPQAFETRTALPPMAAIGGDLKSAVAVARGHRAWLGAHVGDLETPRASEASLRDLGALSELCGVRPRAVAVDAHPDGHAARLAASFAETFQAKSLRIAHHHAHVLSCVAEHDLPLPVLGVAWDGTGFGGDATVWGGELLRVDGQGFERLAHLRRFRLPGGERAVREPRRAALGLLFERFGENVLERDDPPLHHLDPEARRTLVGLMQRGRFAPETSSAGRLFDAAAALLDIRQVCQYEAQAALELESLAAADPDDVVYPMALRDGLLDWGPLLDALLADRDAGVPKGIVATRFHRGLARGLVDAALRAAQATGIRRVVLTGGCFQNALLSRLAQEGLSAAGLLGFAHERVPPGDGGLALGQLLAAAGQLGGDRP